MPSLLFVFVWFLGTADLPKMFLIPEYRQRTLKGRQHSPVERALVQTPGSGVESPESDMSFLYDSLGKVQNCSTRIRLEAKIPPPIGERCLGDESGRLHLGSQSRRSLTL